MKRFNETRTTFDEPHPKNVDYESIEEEGGDYVSALYPYNHVFESEVWTHHRNR